jgi:protein arginine kinase activator
MPVLEADNLADERETCPQCGLTRRELYAQGQMGCARCYETFTAEVQRALKEIHGETRHLGKNG